MACSKDYAQVEDIVGGYDFKLLNEDKDIKLECPICLLLLGEAMGTQCSHLFCKSCLQRLTRQADVRNVKFQCPDCQQIVNEIVPNAFVNRLVTGSDVYYQQNKTGCPWKGSLASFFEKHDRECGYKMVQCQNKGCVISCTKKSLKEHMCEHCEYRIVECEHCTVELKVIELDKHYSSCVKLPTVCPHNECGSIVPKNEMEEHLNTRCEFVIVNCRYATFGCMEKMTRRDAAKHNQSLTNNHMNFMFNQIVDLRQENTKFRNEIDDLRQENTISRNEIDELRQYNAISRNKIDELRQENSKLQNESDNRNTKMENQLNEQKKGIGRQKNEIERQKNEIETQKQEVERHKKEIKKMKEQLQNKVGKEEAHCSKNQPSGYSFNIDELLSKGTEKWIRKKDVQCFCLDYKNWYTKTFLLMKENKLYDSNDVMFVKMTNVKRTKHLFWCSNSKKEQNKWAANDNDTCYHDNGLILHPNSIICTETLNDYNHQNKSTPFVIHPQRQENMITMRGGGGGGITNDTNQWSTGAISEDFYINDFFIICFVKFPW